MDFEKAETGKRKTEGEIMDEVTYLNTCVKYALNTGWVKPEQEELLKEEYLRPIYQKYSKLIGEVKEEIAAEPDSAEQLSKITLRLNHILERTQRIGSTDFNNIIKSINDYRDRFCQSDTYLEYSATSLADFVSDLLYSKN